MPLPRTVARFNRRFSNRLLEPIARRSAGFGIIQHRGRRSGTRYRTPVHAFGAGNDYLVALTYGPSADWVRKVLAGGGQHEPQGRMREITGAEIVGRGAAWAHLPMAVRGRCSDCCASTTSAAYR